MSGFMSGYEAFELYMGRPNRVYLLIGLGYIIFAVVIFHNPILNINLTPVWKETLIRISDTPIINICLSPIFWAIMGGMQVLGCAFYFLVNGFLR